MRQKIRIAGLSHPGAVREAVHWWLIKPSTKAGLPQFSYTMFGDSCGMIADIEIKATTNTDTNTQGKQKKS